MPLQQFVYRGNLDRELSYEELDSNFQLVERYHDQAVEAASVATIQGRIFESLSAGLLGTSDGDYFTTPSVAADEFLDLYKNNAGSGVLIKTYLIPDTSGFISIDNNGDISVNTVELSVASGNTDIDTILTTSQNSDYVKKSTKQEFLDNVVGNTYLKEVYTEKVNPTASQNIDINDGTIQLLSLTASINLSLTLSSGQSLTLHITGGDQHTVTWPTINWISNIPPTLTVSDVVVFWRVGGVIYGSYGGSFV